MAETKNRVEHASAAEALLAFREALAGAENADGFLAAVWEIRGGRLTLTRCTRHDFPLADLPEAERQLAAVNEAERGAVGTPRPAPLPVAEGFDLDQFVVEEPAGDDAPPSIPLPPPENETNGGGSDDETV